MAHKARKKGTPETAKQKATKILKAKPAGDTMPGSSGATLWSTLSADEKKHLKAGGLTHTQWNKLTPAKQQRLLETIAPSITAPKPPPARVKAATGSVRLGAAAAATAAKDKEVAALLQGESGAGATGRTVSTQRAAQVGGAGQVPQSTGAGVQVMQPPGQKGRSFGSVGVNDAMGRVGTPAGVPSARSADFLQKLKQRAAEKQQAAASGGSARGGPAVAAAEGVRAPAQSAAKGTEAVKGGTKMKAAWAVIKKHPVMSAVGGGIAGLILLNSIMGGGDKPKKSGMSEEQMMQLMMMMQARGGEEGGGMAGLMSG